MNTFFEAETSTDKVTAFVGMGSNLGMREQTLAQAVALLQQLPGAEHFRLSSFYLTEAVDCAEPLSFINAVIGFETKLPAKQLLAHLQALEQRFGRRRTYRNAPRTLDLDILFYGDKVMSESADLLLPHPRLHQRLFVLVPLHELAPAWKHPVLGQTVTQMLAAREGFSEAQPLRLNAATANISAELTSGQLSTIQTVFL